MNGSNENRQSSKNSEKETSDMQDEAPFNVWLSRGLHRLFDDIANEPIPDELLKLIQNDKNIK
ncbi:hypothetical protein AA106555_1971 [Neokomagataea thailandica NBRC 106555]|uniref:Anti-sigma factor NepR domain-containing protein n=2 Tax=Neokomagataea TaxID=1223423 RepID=A0A4Y6V9T6_9PROT|nr:MULTISPECIES: NepR family anti-sigma factor [Neokomagataea]QDH25688.1 hypothetical protein D5366_11235 [Neokomagataea tanensis]GBR55256.1 hypothetical protein AA106555_1971 [Neokomagataea thailandica NBRC 106555]